MTDGQRFCETCGVVLELHPWPEDEHDPGCEVAKRKAAVLDDFAFLGGHR